MLFYLGTHVLSHARFIERAFISVNRLRTRKADLMANDWILDSGAFTEIAAHGRFREPVTEYAKQVDRWARCGNMELAVTQDYMCEPFMLVKTGLTIADHQRLTIERYDALVQLCGDKIMPVLQGYEPSDYVAHVRQYGDRLTDGMRVGVGSVCKRNAKPQAIIAVLSAIKAERPDLRLHGFGLKITSLEDAYITSLLYSADSMAWSYHARMNGGNANGLPEALGFANRINRTAGCRASQLALVEVQP